VPFGLGNGTFDSNMVDLSIIVSTLSLGIKISVRTSSDYEDCVVSGESVGLLWGLLDLWWRWWWRVGFGIDLRIGVFWYWVCDLWHYRRIYYLWSWRRLWMISCGVEV
jgi:hypothetical protein